MGTVDLEAVDCRLCSIWIEDFKAAPKDRYLRRKLVPNSVRNAANNGCPICSAFVDLCSPLTTAEFEVTIGQVFAQNSKRREVIALSTDTSAPIYPCFVFCAADLPDPWGIFPVRSEIITGFGPDGCHRLASKWIRRCVTTHGCGSAGTDKPFPSRLIEIDKNLQRLKLVQSKGRTGRYVSLSHCWGIKHTFETTTQTLPQFLSGFSYDEMPTVYREAVMVTQMLGISHLWIDSLCIIQDDRDDWRREAAQMADIYLNCFLTIAATRSSSNTSTMYHGRRDRECFGITAMGNPYRLLSQTGISHLSSGRLDSEEKKFPLLTRGWVFQERLLSPRVLHFGPDELFWECNEEFLCECERSSDTELSKASYARLLAEGTRDQLEQSWRHLVQQYSAMQLTETSDKLPAFAGIAKQFHQRRPDSTYLAGLWSSSLLDDMLWFCDEYQEDLNFKPEVWRAPSWSWVAVNQRVYYPAAPKGSGYVNLLNLKVLARYALANHAECMPAGPAAMAEVKSGQVNISGPVLRGYYGPRQCHDRYEYDLFISTPGQASTETFFSTELRESGSLNRKSGRNRLYFDYRDKAPAERQPQRVEVLCLQMARKLRRTHSCLDAVEYILLLREAEQQAGAYERVGMAIIMKEYDGIFERAEALLEEDRARHTEFTADEEAEIWDDFVSPFDAGVNGQVVTII